MLKFMSLFSLKSITTGITEVLRTTVRIIYSHCRLEEPSMEHRGSVVNHYPFILSKLVFMVFITLLASCSSAFSQDEKASQQQTISSDLAQALTTAEQAQDYRLLVTATRGISIPGLEQKDYSAAIDLCGKKYMPQTGDVITTEQDRAERKKALAYMRQYNEKMWLLCKSKNLAVDN